MHVPGADLKHIHILGGGLYLFRRHNLGDHGKVELVTGLPEYSKGLLPHPLEGIGRCPGFPRTAPENPAAVFRHGFRGPDDHFLVLNGTRTGDQHRISSAENGFAHNNLSDRHANPFPDCSRCI